MRFLWVIGLLAFVTVLQRITAQDIDEDNEFADFEFDDEEEVVSKVKKPQEQVHQHQSEKTTDNFADEDDSDDGIVENEFDNDEFENFGGTEGETGDFEKKAGEPKLTIVNKVPLHFRKWHSYWVELLFISGLVVYFINYTIGKGKNISLCARYNKFNSSLRGFSLLKLNVC